MNDEDESSNTTLHLAALEGQVKCVQELLEHGAEVDARWGTLTHMISYCITTGHYPHTDHLQPTFHQTLTDHSIHLQSTYHPLTTYSTIHLPLTLPSTFHPITDLSIHLPSTHLPLTVPFTYHLQYHPLFINLLTTPSTYLPLTVPPTQHCLPVPSTYSPHTIPIHLQSTNKSLVTVPPTYS